VRGKVEKPRNKAKKVGSRAITATKMSEEEEARQQQQQLRQKQQ